MDLTQQTITTLKQAIATKQASAEQITQLYLDRIEQFDGDLGAYNQVFADRAIERAKAVDAGQITGPLAGVPIAVKDNMTTTFGRTTCSSKILKNFESPYNATVIEKLEEAGAVILGKANLDEFAMGSSTENSGFKPTKNPWDTKRVPGGSSGGSAAAVAADLCIASLGSDTGGSIRQPAAYCGVVGLKPTYGLVSRFGLVAYASSLDQIGPIAHCVEDAALLLNVIAGHDPHDSTSVTQPINTSVPDYTAKLHEPVANLKIGIAKQYMGQGNDPAMTEALNNAIGQFEKMGTQIVEVDLPHTEYGIATYYIVATAEASSNLARYDGVHYGHRTDTPDDLIDLYAASRAEGFGDEVKLRIMLGTYALSSGYYDAYYLKALKVRRLIKNDFDKAFEKVDAIICPTTTSPAFALGEKTDDPLAMYLDDVYTVNCNLAGIPGISLPGGFAEVDGKKLPLGLQLFGQTFSEEKILRIAQMLESTHDHHNFRPKLS